MSMIVDAGSVSMPERRQSWWAKREGQGVCLCRKGEPRDAPAVMLIRMQTFLDCVKSPRLCFLFLLKSSTNLSPLARRSTDLDRGRLGRLSTFQQSVAQSASSRAVPLRFKCAPRKGASERTGRGPGRHVFDPHAPSLENMRVRQSERAGAMVKIAAARGGTGEAPQTTRVE